MDSYSSRSLRGSKRSSNTVSHQSYQWRSSEEKCRLNLYNVHAELAFPDCCQSSTKAKPWRWFVPPNIIPHWSA